MLLGLFFWLPFWAFFNLCALYVDSNLDTARLYRASRASSGQAFADFLSHADEDGARRILGETISHTGYIIMILQVFVSGYLEKLKAMPSFLFGLAVAAVGFAVLGYARVSAAPLVFLGIFLFAVGEMISSPRIQEYITWIAPKEKAGLYMGSNFLAVGIGGFSSGVIYTTLYGYVKAGPSRVRVVRPGRALPPGDRRAQRVREALRRVPRAGGLTRVIRSAGAPSERMTRSAVPEPSKARRRFCRRPLGRCGGRGCRRGGRQRRRVGADRAIRADLDRAEDALDVDVVAGPPLEAAHPAVHRVEGEAGPVHADGCRRAPRG